MTGHLLFVEDRILNLKRKRRPSLPMTQTNRKTDIYCSQASLRVAIKLTHLAM